jgi:hypothetical protein
MSFGRYQPRDQQIFDLQSDAGLILEHQSTVFIGSKAAALSFTIRLTGTPVTVSLALVANGRLHTPAQLRAQIKRLLELMKAAAWFFTQRSPRWQHRRQQALPLLVSVWVEYAAFRRVLLIFPCVATACHRLVTAPSDMHMARMSWSWAEVVMERVTRGRVKRVPVRLQRRACCAVRCACRSSACVCCVFDACCSKCWLVLRCVAALLSGCIKRAAAFILVCRLLPPPALQADGIHATFLNRYIKETAFRCFAI